MPFNALVAPRSLRRAVSPTKCHGQTLGAPTRSTLITPPLSCPGTCVAPVSFFNSHQRRRERLFWTGWEPESRWELPRGTGHPRVLPVSTAVGVPLLGSTKPERTPDVA